jgi:hypothetical protein
MPEKAFLSDLRRAREEEYFRKQDQKLIEEQRRGVLREAEKRNLGAVVGISDEHLVTELLDEGFTAERIPLLYLVPALEVAWADGSVSDSEHECLLKFACEQGASRDSPAYRQLLAWLADRPPAEFFASTLRLIGSVCHAQSPIEAEATVTKVTSYCSQIAEASGSWLGLGSTVSRTEAQFLKRITSFLRERIPTAIHRTCGGICD